MLIYLAGAITVHHKNNQMDHAYEWRHKSIDLLEKQDNFQCFDPTVNFLENFGAEVPCKSVVAQNRHYLEKSDIVLLNLDMLHESPGTLWELYVANENNIPVYAFGDSEWSWSPHVNQSITGRFKDLYTTINHIKNMYHKF